MELDKLPLIAQASVESEKATGVPAQLTLAQCALESGWLAHAPGNNCFGIKSYTGEHGRQLLTTEEWFTPEELKQFLARGEGRSAVPLPKPALTNGRHCYAVEDWFATFASLSDCFNYRAAIFKEGKYAPFTSRFQNDRNLEAFVRGVAGIYATDPRYAETILKISSQSDVRQALAEAKNKLLL